MEAPEIPDGGRCEGSARVNEDRVTSHAVPDPHSL